VRLMAGSLMLPALALELATERWLDLRWVTPWLMPLVMLPVTPLANQQVASSPSVSVSASAQAFGHWVMATPQLVAT